MRFSQYRGPIEYAGSEGCHLLINDGAKLVHNIDDILTEIQIVYPTNLPKAVIQPVALESSLQDVLDLIDFTQLSMQKICLDY